MTNCLLEAASIRKNKISLTDYNYQRDIENRLLMSCFSDRDLEVLEEILYSSIQIPLEKLAKNLDLSKETLMPTLEKLSQTGLLTLSEDKVFVDKDMRKYFEVQIEKFSEDFTPGMDFLQGLLKKPPIHVLPIWYSIPRTSNNIFDSLVEKYLQTPQIFQRYILELNLGEPILKNIIQDVYSAPGFEITSDDLMDKYQISREIFEEYMLHLEFSFVCCLGYKKKGEVWIEIVTPFHEWREYLRFLETTETKKIADPSKVQLKRPSEFSFVQDLALILDQTQKKPLTLIATQDSLCFSPESKKQLIPLFPGSNIDENINDTYLNTLLFKLTVLRLANAISGELHITEAGLEWLGMRLDSQALYLYRHPKNEIQSYDFTPENYSEKALKEAEKSICRVLHKDWVFYDEFQKGIIAPLRDEHAICLKKVGRNWAYTVPNYTEQDAKFIQATVLQRLFEAGLVQVGTLEGRDCFRVTSLGQTLFAK